MTYLSGKRGSLHLGSLRIVAYYPQWGIYKRNYQVADVPANHLTHLIYAFAGISDTGEVKLLDTVADTQKSFQEDRQSGSELRGNFHQLQLLKVTHPHLKTLISIGGAKEDPARFSAIANSAENREKFVRSCLDLFLRRWPGVFDGFDIDWEFPNSADKQNLTLLLQEFRRQMDALGRDNRTRYLLTIAAPAGVKHYKCMDLAGIGRSVDWFNLMSYRFYGTRSKLTGFDAPLYPDAGIVEPDAVQRNVDAVVEGYLAAGVPGDKIVVGIPASGCGYSGVPNLENGLHQENGGIPPPGTWSPGSFDYKDIKTNYLTKWKRFFSQTAKVPWLYSPRDLIWISYDDPESVKYKADYVRNRHLGGLMLWELSGDGGELISAMYKGLTMSQKKHSGVPH